jgi:hypothetical protein
MHKGRHGSALAQNTHLRHDAFTNILSPIIEERPLKELETAPQLLQLQYHLVHNMCLCWSQTVQENQDAKVICKRAV